MTTNNSTIGSLVTGLSIVDIIAHAKSPMKFTDIQEATKITKSNLYKYLNTLTLSGFIYRDPRQGDYSLGYKFVEYSSNLLQANTFLDRLSDPLKEISRIANMTAVIATWVNDRPMIAKIANTNLGLNIGATIGTELPLLSAVGKVFAAFIEEDRTQAWKNKSISEDEYQLISNELQKINEEKFAYSKEPLVRHVSSISFPILNYKKEIVAAVGVIGFTEDVPTLFNDSFNEKIIPIIEEMCGVFGYSKD